MTYYLYLKTHNVTGLKYLGKTERSDFHKYPGSGIRWKYHLNKHGHDYTTQCLLKTDSHDELRETGLFFSRLWNIVCSPEFANLTEEDGNGGSNFKHIERTKEWANNIRQSKIGSKNPMWKGGHTIQPKPKKTRSEYGMSGLTHHSSSKKKISDSLSKWMWITDGTSNKKVLKESVIPDGWVRGMTR